MKDGGNVMEVLDNELDLILTRISDLIEITEEYAIQGYHGGDSLTSSSLNSQGGATAATPTTIGGGGGNDLREFSSISGPATARSNRK
eukprot:scaffold344_cov178-Ochromonas_danica.AAC.16